jgi:hypothetical protein
MATILIVESASGKTTVQDDVFGNHDVRYLTLEHKNSESGNRYYVSLTGEAADIEWQEGDSIMVELGFIAYKTGGRWHTSHHSNSIQFVETENVNIKD